MLRFLPFVFFAFVSLAHAETWTFQSVALTPSQGWEYTPSNPFGSVLEPKVIQRSSGCLVVASPCLAMWYSGGWEKCAIGYAETVDLTGKTGWNKYSGNPIAGQNALGIAIACRKTVVEYGGNVYLIFSDSIGGTSGNLWITHSANGVTSLTTPTKIISNGTYDISLANSHVWLEGSRWRMVYEANTSSNWQMFEATAPSISGPWSKLNLGQSNPIFQVTGGAYSGPFVTVLNGLRHVWTHQSPQFGTVLPSSIYHACDPTGFVGLTVANGGNPVVSPRSGFDQVADPWLLDLGGVGTLFADEDNNVTPYAQISVWTTTGPLASLSCP